SLAQFSTMQLLCVVCRMFCDQYGYSFFRPALEDAILELDDVLERNEESAIAMFLLHTAYGDSGGKINFDSLIDAYGDGLPFAVKLGITHEAKRMSLLTSRVKKMERNIRRSLVGGKGRGAATGAEFMNRLYKIPIAEL